MGTYCTNPDALHETIDGETIIIDLATGTYYSLRGSAPAIWHALAEGASVETTVEHLHSLYDTVPDEIAVRVEAFLGELEAEGLIALGTGPAAPVPATDEQERLPFEPPELEKYEDLQDIILLDPVHKVDDRGWPHAAPVGGESA